MTHLLNSPAAVLLVATTVTTYAHFAAHVGIAIGYLLAMTRNNNVIGKLMRVSLLTKIAGAGFFLFCGATHMGLALGISNSPVITVTDELQLVSIYVFLVALLLDSRRAVLRLSNALLALRKEFNGIAIIRGDKGEEAIEQGRAERLDIGSQVVATIEFALFDRGDRPFTKDR